MRVHSGRGSRNSGLELLRIIGMVMIVFNHSPFSFLLGRRFPEVGTAGSAVMTVLSGFGGIGDILFFGITAWFLAMEEPDVRRSIRRAWMLERQLLVTSFFLFAVFLVLRLQGVPSGLDDRTTMVKMTLKTMFPVIGMLWWYPTSYVIFCLIHPWLQSLLRSLGRRRHLRLVVLLLLVWGLTPMKTLDMAWSIVLFLYLYVIISFIRWYVPNGLAVRYAPVITTIGLCATVLGLAVMGVLWSLAGSFARTTYFNSPRSISSLMAGLGMIMLFGHMKWHSPAVNKIASTMFTPYLFADYPLTGGVLSILLKPYLQTGSDIAFIGTALLFPPLFIVCASLTDLIRQMGFALTIDRHSGRWFDRLWKTVAVTGFMDRIESWLDHPDLKPVDSPMEPPVRV